jgi:hypothetical protein
MELHEDCDAMLLGNMKMSVSMPIFYELEDLLLVFFFALLSIPIISTSSPSL